MNAKRNPAGAGGAIKTRTTKNSIPQYYNRTTDLAILRSLSANPKYPRIINILAGGIARHLDQEERPV